MTWVFSETFVPLPTILLPSYFSLWCHELVCKEHVLRMVFDLEEVYGILVSKNLLAVHILGFWGSMQVFIKTLFLIAFFKSMFDFSDPREQKISFYQENIFLPVKH